MKSSSLYSTAAPKIPFLGVLTLNRPDLLVRLVESIDYPVAHMAILYQNVHPKNFGNHLCVVDTEELIRNKSKFVEKFTVIQCNMNIGVSRGWNYFFRNFGPDDDCVDEPYYWLISGDDNYFAPGALAKIAAAITPERAANNVLFMFRMIAAATTPTKEISSGFSTYVATKRLFENVGMFDENIYPAYYEDSDLWKRIVVSGEPTTEITEVKIISGDNKHSESCSLKSLSSEHRKRADECFQRNREYFHKKWGEQREFTAPFNCGDKYTFKDIPEHENYVENQKIIMGHSNPPEFHIMTFM